MNILDVGYRSTHYYLLPLASGMFLVDCGWYGMMGQFVAQFRRMGVDPADVKYVLATHYHMDHAGLVNEFKQLGARLMLMESQTGAVVAAVPPVSAKPPLLITTSSAGNILLTFADSRSFLASIGLQGEIVSTPAHSRDSVSLVLDDGSAFTGDLPPRALVSDEDPALKASWAELESRGVTRVYPAHGSYPLGVG